MPSRRPPRWLPWLLVAALVGLALWRLPLDRWLLALVEWVRGAGAAGAVAYVTAYVAACVAFVPGSLLTLGAGFAYGVVRGTLLVMVASTLGAAAAFVLGRTVLRARIQRRLTTWPRFAAVEQAVAEQGFRVVLLLRLSPLFPFNLLNYALGLTRVPLGTYVLASVLGMFPGTVLYVYLGSLVTSAAELTVGGARARGGPLTQAFFWGGLVATVLVTVVVTRYARRALDRRLASPGGAP